MSKNCTAAVLSRRPPPFLMTSTHTGAGRRPVNLNSSSAPSAFVQHKCRGRGHIKRLRWPRPAASFLAHRRRDCSAGRCYFYSQSAPTDRWWLMILFGQWRQLNSRFWLSMRDERRSGEFTQPVFLRAVFPFLAKIHVVHSTVCHSSPGKSPLFTACSPYLTSCSN